MAIYSITDLAELSGVKAHTLRVWEQRYGVLSPKRTHANVRYYDDEDMRHLLNVALLNRNGLKISKIVKLSQKELAQRVADLASVEVGYTTQLDALTLSMLEMNEQRFDRILTTNINQLGFEETMMTVIFPFLEKLSVLWITGSVKPVQENFTSGLIRRKLMVAIEELEHPDPETALSLMLFLPDNEKQEMPLMLLHYLAKKRGMMVYYLGRDTSLQDVEDAYQVIKPNFVFTLITETFAGGSVSQYVDFLLPVCEESTLLLSGYQAVSQQLQPHERLRVLSSMNEALEFLDLQIALQEKLAMRRKAS